MEYYPDPQPNAQLGSIDQNDEGFEILSRLKKVFGDKAFAHQMPCGDLSDIGLGRFQIGWRDPDDTPDGKFQIWYGSTWMDAWGSLLAHPPNIAGPWQNCSGKPFVDDSVDQVQGFAVLAAPEMPAEWVKTWTAKLKPALGEISSKIKQYGDNSGLDVLPLLNNLYDAANADFKQWHQSKSLYNS